MDSSGLFDRIFEGSSKSERVLSFINISRRKAYFRIDGKREERYSTIERKFKI